MKNSWGRVISISVLILACVIIAGFVIRAQTKPTEATPLDIEILRRTELQLQSIQKEFQSQFEKVTDPIQKERSAVRDRLCIAAKIPESECVIDLMTRRVTRRPVEKPNDKGKK